MFQIGGDILPLLLLPLLLLLATGVIEAEVCNHHLTIFAEPGRMECYHQSIAAPEHISIEYKVIDGGQAEAHINFMLMDPHRKLLVSDHKEGELKHKLIANETGVYNFCFDNTISTFNRKIVAFTLQVEPHNQEELETKKLVKDMTVEYQYDRTYTLMDDYIKRISLNLERSRQIQNFFRIHEAKDRKLAESNYTLVNNWSCAQLIAMILVGMLQVIMLRSIFNTTGTIHKFWKKI